MSTVIGVVVFVIGMVVSVTLHEFGHLLSAKAFGMKARRFYFGFGPKVWSFQRGETEYGVKAIPAGGFVDIAGMTDREELAPEDRPRAFYRAKPWKRIVVMLAGIGINLVTGWILLVLLFTFIGTGKVADQPPVAGQIEACLGAGASAPTSPGSPGQPCPQGTQPSPAAQAGLQPGDRFVRVGQTPVSSWDDVVTAVQKAGPGPVTLVVERDGTQVTLRPDLAAADAGGKTVGRLGVAAPEPPRIVYQGQGLGDGIVTASRTTGLVAAGTAKAVWSVPAAIPHLIGSILGSEQRTADGFVSVVGAAQVSGQLASTDVPVIGRVADLLFLIAGLNLTVGLINLVPLPPFDGGHMAATVVEVVRNGVLRLLGRQPRGHVDPASYQGLTIVGVVVILVFGLLIVTNDILNPIQLPSP